MPLQHAGFHKRSCHTCSQKMLMLFPTGMNHQEQQNGFQRPYLPDAAGCSHAASPTSASGRGRCQTLDHGNTPLLEGSRLKGSKPPSPDRGFHTCKGTELRTSRTSLRNSELGKRNLSLLSRRGSVTISLPARARRRLCRQGRYSAAIQTHSSLAV